MTRFLSESLEAKEPFFRLQLREIERANGNPNADIHLSNQIATSLREKILLLGLDPNDTTPQELYRALQGKLLKDDSQLTKVLRTYAATHVSAEANVMDGLVHVLKTKLNTQSCFTLKTSRFKQLMHRHPPKKVMKQLGYRSLDSLLRHESIASIVLAAKMLESKTWWSGYLTQYKSLSSLDFEIKPITINSPKSNKWILLSEQIVTKYKHNVFAFSELGQIIILPLPSNAPKGSAITSSLLAIQALNDIQSASTYLQVCQVRPDFGSQVQQVMLGEPQLTTTLFDRSVPWHIIQRSLHLLSSNFHELIFEPHFNFKNMQWLSIGQALEIIDPQLSFWRNSEPLAVLHERRAVSTHVLDVALGVCNKVPFEKRIIHYFQQSLWQELLLRYMQSQTLEQTLLAAFQPTRNLNLITSESN